jgi:type I restriction enzyme M protein
MNNQEIVAKLWNLCNVLRDDGITYHQYVTELTYILFLKMCKETGREEDIPEKYRWDSLMALTGIPLKDHYKDVLTELGKSGKGRIREIYAGAISNIDEPANLQKIIKSIDQFGQGGFSGAVMSQDGNKLSLLDLDADVRKGGSRCLLIRKRNILRTNTKLVILQNQHTSIDIRKEKYQYSAPGADRTAWLE